MKSFGKLAVLGLGIFVMLQFIRPEIPTAPATAEVNAPEPVRHVLQKDCYSCHSNERRLAWFDQVVPAYWLVRHDILRARDRLNFSTLGSKHPAMQKGALYEAVNMMQLGAMPLAQFRLLHPEAAVTAEDLTILKTYLAPWRDAPPQQAPLANSAAAVPSAAPPPSPEFNGLGLDPGYKDWKVLSVTDRGDNNSFRFILGNDVAVQAVRSGKLSPWPNGAKIAKIAWQKSVGKDGLVYPSNFIQVELMAKQAQQFTKTDGWGWGRWRGMDLKPYGKDARFVEECTGCHLPVRPNDSVYTLPITATRVTGSEVVNNRASLPQTLPHQPLDWSPFTMYVDPANKTMAILFVDKNSSGDRALVTWSQREDPHWFGARIPDQPGSVEFVEASKADSYSRFAGRELTASPLAADAAEQRVRFIRSLTKAPLP
jgi:hypothetical protein